jgi:16S rRNA (guanine966-N2)-methyltransferase
VGSTRPTAERVREGLGSALEARHAIRGASVLDLFAGTGALAFEMLSRGADRAVLAERDHGALRRLEASAASLGLADRVRLVALDLCGDPGRVAGRLAPLGPFGLVMADPPWDRVEVVPPLVLALAAAGGLGAGAWLVLEHAKRRPPALSDGLATEATYRYGDTAVLVARVTSPEEPRPS